VKPTLTLSLVSHTNVGKTTLARTLLRRDVGEVLDQAHVTDESARYTLIESAQGERLELWDTPGFGDSARLVKRLRGESNPLGWLASQVWDRLMDRPFWCGQQAVKNVREQADLVLYQVNAAERPEEAGYVEPEMELLSWIGRPVLVLLNQTGPPRASDEREAEEGLWRAHAERWPIVRDVLGLDAFSRCWLEEGELFERVRAALPKEHRALCGRLLGAWRERQLDDYRAALDVLGAELARAAADREALAEGGRGGGERRRAMRALAQRLEDGLERALERLIAIYGLDGRAAIELKTALADFALEAESLTPRKAGLLGGVVSGLATGVTADLMLGGLGLGSGMIVGAILGGLGAAGLARAYREVRGAREPRVTWSDSLLARSATDLLLRYLAVAHHGRGRGEWREREQPAFWSAAVGAALSARRAAWNEVWASARAAEPGAVPAALVERTTALLSAATRDVLAGIYPEARRLL